MHEQTAPTTPQHTAAAFPLASPCSHTHKTNNRLEDFGPKRLTPADKPGFLARLWAQLNNILIYILLAAAIVEGALQSWAEFGLVMGVIVVNTAIGLIQEGKAEKVCEAGCVWCQEGSVFLLFWASPVPARPGSMLGWLTGSILG